MNPLGIFKKKMVIESSSSSVKSVLFILCDEMGSDVTLSNPYAKAGCPVQKKKTDRIDARILTVLTGNYLIECYVPSQQAMQDRKLVGFRHPLVHHRTGFMNSIHGILL